MTRLLGAKLLRLLNFESLLDQFERLARRLGVLETDYDDALRELSVTNRQLKSDEEDKWLAGFPRHFRDDWVKSRRLR